MKHFLGGLLLLTACALAQADTSLLLYGASKHNGCDKSKYKCKFEQFNPGAGLEWSPFEEWWGRPFVRGGAYSDSEKKFAYFAAGGWRKDFHLTENLKFGAGIYAGYLNGSDHNGAAAIPFLSLAYRKVALEVGYGDSKLGHHTKHEEVPAVITFNARIDFY